jgi:homocysteine S-methyltransferase
VQALVELLEEEDIQVPSWICFSSVDGKHLCSGESFGDCLQIINASEKVAIVGVNCTPPQFVEGIIREFKKVCDSVFPFPQQLSQNDVSSCSCFLMFVWSIRFQQQTEKAIAVYPNSGEVWDGRAKRWLVSTE